MPVALPVGWPDTVIVGDVVGVSRLVADCVPLAVREVLGLPVVVGVSDDVMLAVRDALGVTV